MTSKTLSKFLLAICCSTLFVVNAKADIVNLVADPGLSTANVSIAGSAADTSATSGTGVIDLVPPSSPFGTAQITALNMIYDDDMTWTFGGGLVTATTLAGDVMVDMVTPGSAGVVSGGLFDQLGNTMQLSGTMNILDPFNLVGGNQILDLSTLAASAVDFNNTSIVQSGSMITVSADYSIAQTVNLGGTDFLLNVDGNLVSNGFIAVPEAGGMFALMTLAGVFATRRKRVA